MRAVLLVLALTALAACHEDAPTPVADPLALIGTGTDWRITEIAGAAVPEAVSVTMLSPEPGMIAGRVLVALRPLGKAAPPVQRKTKRHGCPPPRVLTRRQASAGARPRAPAAPSGSSRRPAPGGLPG